MWVINLLFEELLACQKKDCAAWRESCG